MSPAATPKGPRPRATAGGALMIAGGALAVIGVFLPWVSVDGGSSINGMDDFLMSDLSVVESPGIVGLIGGLIGIGLGLALVLAGRVLAVAIVGVVGAALGLLIGFGLTAIANDTKDSLSFLDASLGIGAILQPIGALVALAGAITALARRRVRDDSGVPGMMIP